MTYQIELINESNYTVNTDRLQKAAETTLSLQSAKPESSLTIVITDNEEVAALNKKYRDVDSPTDVLSFPAEPLPKELEQEMAEEASYLGDLIIAYPYALAQAEREGHSPEDSFDLLVVHGTLHLLGFDHDTPENRAAMWVAQEAALNILKISPAIVPALEGVEGTHDENPQG